MVEVKINRCVVFNNKTGSWRLKQGTFLYLLSIQANRERSRNNDSSTSIFHIFINSVAAFKQVYQMILTPRLFLNKGLRECRLQQFIYSEPSPDSVSGLFLSLVVNTSIGTNNDTMRGLFFRHRGFLPRNLVLLAPLTVAH